MKEIKLQLTADGIMAHNFVDGRPDAEIVNLFGTHILPTAFYSATSVAKALKEIRILNPDATVIVMD